MNSLVLELTEHHEMFREHTLSIEQLLSNNQLEKAYGLLCIYMNELLDHIAAENDELFVIAESLLSKEDQESIYFRFKDIDVQLGESRKEHLCTILEDIDLNLDLK